MFYQIARPLLFKLPPEYAHHLSLLGLQWARSLGFINLIAPSIAGSPVDCMGMTFPNMLGLAAGADKNGDYIDSLGALGFGFLEVGTVTPRPQSGNPQPRLFRLPQAGAIINRMGFNNKGVDHLVMNLQKRRYDGMIGVNIGKNFDTPLEQAEQDYLICLQKVYPHADYIVINVSSPNTEGLRELQREDALSNLLAKVKNKQMDLSQTHNRIVPLLVKIAPDLDGNEIEAIARLAKRLELDGIIATNTTVARDAVQHLPHSNEMGGLSGAPLHSRSLEVIRKLRHALGSSFPIIGVGGIMSRADAVETLHAGANLLQVYTGFVYRGPRLIREIVNGE
ncbi:quinone-dependent dihydroorotate dehydrogenase [Chloroflexi bacterium TSY]|nr:quinone-dependent dihydroorotate dehydrogenase [Chloroflexi bacterium TSY]